MPDRPKPPSKPGQRFNKACDSCHISKVRCTPDPQSPNGTCKRCTKNGTPCVFSPVGPRRRPVRTKNDRIAELERRVRDMQLKLEKEVEKRSSSAAVPSRRDDGQARTHAPSKHGGGKAPVSGLRSAASEFDPKSNSSGSTIAAAGAALAVTGSDVQPSQVSSSSASFGVTKRSSIAATGHYRAVSSTTSSSDSSPSSTTSSSALRIATAQVGAPISEEPLSHASSTREADVIDRGLITQAQADQLLREFRLHIADNFLGMCIPDEMGPERLRRERPKFWLSILGAASTGSIELLSLSPVLFQEVQNKLDLGMISPPAKPDLDTLQTYMNYTGFYYDHVCSTGVRVVEICYRAITMAVQMAETFAVLHLPDDCTLSEGDVTSEDIQLSRELLRWYWACVSLLIKNRQVKSHRTTVLRLMHFVNPCVRVLRTTHKHEDMRLVEWVKLVQITANTVFALHEGHTGEIGGLSDKARDAILDSFERRRKQWLVECPFDLVNEIMMLEYHYYVLLVSEFIYPAGFADFQSRSQGLPSLSTIKRNNSEPSPDQNFFAPYKIQYTRKCIRAAQSCLDVVTIHNESNDFNSTTPPDIFRRLGAFPYSRIFYALRFLLFVTHEIFKTQKYNIINIEALRVDSYIASLKRRLAAAAAGGSYRYPSLWLYALTTRIEPWYRELKALLEKDRPTRELGRPQGGESSGSSCAGTSPDNERGPPADLDHLPSNTDETWFNGPMSPLLLELPFEFFSSPEAYTMPPPAAVPGLYNNNISGTAEPLGFTTAPVNSSTDPTGYRPAQLPDFTNNMHPVQAGIGQADPTGELDTSLGNMDLDSFDNFDWDDFSRLVPSSDMFFSQYSPFVPGSNAPSYQQPVPGKQGLGVDGEGEKDDT